MSAAAPAAAPAFDLAAANAHVVAVVERASSSFSMGMKSLPPAERQAMFAIYAFCREVDDVADEGGSTEERLAELELWRAEVASLYAGAPTRLTSLALLEPVRRFNLPQEEFLALIDGMEMDARETMHAPDMATLLLYCRRVAGTAGLLSLPIFGADEPEAPTFALALSNALQLTNILRDIAEDAGRDRLYLPRELLLRHSIDPDLPAKTVYRHPSLAWVFRDLAREARRCYAEADRALARCNRKRLRPALLMMAIYEAVLDHLERTGWRPDAPPPRLSKPAKLWAALTRGLLRPVWRPST
ncbi:MAG: presqualene diphosphate synthase HpnD [Rhodospirillaceae bacterium]